MDRVSFIKSLAKNVDLSYKDKTSGIYCWLNSVNGKTYIGRSNNVLIRRNGHRHKLNNQHYKAVNPHFQSAWDKYGEKNFKFLILEIVTDNSSEIIAVREQYWIDYLLSYDRKFGYNCMSKQGGSFGHSKESIEKMKNKAKGRKHSEKTKRKLSITNSDGRCLSFNGSMPQKIRDKISNSKKGKSNGPFSLEHRKNISISLTGKKLSYEHIDSLKKSHIKPNYKLNKEVVQYDMDENKIKTFFSASEASRQTEGTHPSGISRCCRGLQKHCGGFIWKYKK